MRAITVFIGVVVLVACAALAGADPVPPPTSQTVVDRNIGLTTTVSYLPVQKVSGTNAAFEATASVDAGWNCSGKAKWNGYYLADVTVKIGDEVVKTWVADPAAPVPSVTFDVRWDTTHFHHGDAPAVTCTAHATVIRYGTAPAGQPAPVLEGPTTIGRSAAGANVAIYNYGWVGDIPQFAISVMAVAAFNAMIACNHCCPGTLIADLHNTLVGIHDSTVFYFDGHGSGLPTFSSGTGWYIYDVWRVVDPDDPESRPDNNVYAPRLQAFKDGLPPMNFAFIDACLTCQATVTNNGNEMAKAFLLPCGTLTDDGVVWTVDRAEMGWSVECYPYWSNLFTPIFWTRFAQGATANDARARAWDALYQYYLPLFDPNNHVTQIPQDPRAYTCLWGDQQMRIHGLYGSSEGPDHWYEVEVGND